MKGVKVLQLDHWMISDFRDQEETLRRLKQIAPVLHRPGRYLQRTGRGEAFAWFELPDGRAFATEAQQFRFELQSLEVAELDQNKIEAIKHVVDQRVATAEQAETYEMWRHNQEIRHIRRAPYRARILKRRAGG